MKAFNMAKRTWATGLILIVALAVTGCGNKPAPIVTPPPPPTNPNGGGYSGGSCGSVGGQPLTQSPVSVTLIGNGGQGPSNTMTLSLFNGQQGTAYYNPGGQMSVLASAQMYLSDLMQMGSGVNPNFCV